MADTQEVCPATLLDQLASLDPHEHRELSTTLRRLSETLAEVPDGKMTSTRARRACPPARLGGTWVT